MQLTIGKQVHFYNGQHLLEGVVTAILGKDLVVVQADDGLHRLNPFEILLKQGNVYTEFYLPESD